MEDETEKGLMVAWVYDDYRIEFPIVLLEEFNNENIQPVKH